MRYGLLWVVVFSYGLVPTLEAGDSLGSYTIDLDGITVSGVSSGGYMAQQFHVAHSELVRGAAILAGGPYYCAGKGYPFNLWKTLSKCMKMFFFWGPPNVESSIEATRLAAARGAIDNPENMNTDKVYLFSGTLDDNVPQPIMDTLYAYYQEFVDAENIVYVNNIPAAHAMITDDFGNTACHLMAEPYINDCNYDAAGELLQQLYGPLNPPIEWKADSLLTFNQSDFVDDPEAHSLNVVGHIYVPQSCVEGVNCRLHVAFHGCLQYEESIGDVFYTRTGYNEWAEANNIIVLYPQTTARTYLLLPWPNPAGCWDWWGYTNSDFHLQNGVQIAAVKAMIDRLTRERSDQSKWTGIRGIMLRSGFKTLQVSARPGINR